MSFISRKVVVFALVIAPTMAIAGLFGPSNFDECVLDGIKEAKTDTAAQMVAQACRNKFPLKAATPKDDFGEIRVSFYDDKTGNWDNLNNRIRMLSIKEKSGVYGAKTEIRVMNDYGFGLSGIYVGVVSKGKSCPNNYSGYKEVVGCGGQVGSRQSGNVYCEKLTGAFYCVTGFVTEAGDHKKLIKMIDAELGATFGK